jgi:predicted nucleic acid-binding protein
MAGTPYLVDTNILIRWVKPDDRDYPLVASAIDAVLSGVQVHDARLAAAMHVHGIQRVLTFNARDFARYPDIQAVHPQALLTRNP